MLQRFVKENLWYIIALAVAIGGMLACLYAFSGAQAINTTRAQNAARAESLQAEIQALPRVSSVSPAQTSGAIDHVLTTRMNLIEAINAEYIPRYAPWPYRVIPTYDSTRTQQNQHTDIVKDISSNLQRTAKDLAGLKKIIEYMPLIDLGQDFANDAGLEERLSRTKQGLNEAIGYIQLSGLAHEAELISRLKKLNAQTLTLTDQTKGSWAAEVLEIQKLIIADIERRDVQRGEGIKQLQRVSQSYTSDYQ